MLMPEPPNAGNEIFTLHQKHILERFSNPTHGVSAKIFYFNKLMLFIIFKAIILYKKVPLTLKFL